MIKICQSVVSVVEFLMHGCNDDEEMKSYTHMIKETRGYMLYLQRRQREEDNVKLSLCELREQGKALNFTDLVKVCRCQWRKVQSLKKAIRQRDISSRARDTLSAMLLVEMKRLSVISTLLKYPMRTSELNGAVVRWTQNTGR